MDFFFCTCSSWLAGQIISDIQSPGWKTHTVLETCILGGDIIIDKTQSNNAKNGKSNKALFRRAQRASVKDSAYTYSNRLRLNSWPKNFGGRIQSKLTIFPCWMGHVQNDWPTKLSNSSLVESWHIFLLNGFIPNRMKRASHRTEMVS